MAHPSGESIRDRWESGRIRPSGVNPVTIREVAQRAGVSIATVSRVLNNVPGTVRDAPRQRVLQAAQALDYRASAQEKHLAVRNGPFALRTCGNP